MSAATDARNSRVARNMRPVENLVQNRLDLTAKQRHDSTVSKSRQNVVKRLVTRLAYCTTEAEVDETIQACSRLDREFLSVHEEKVDFSLLIRNAELNARRLIRAGGKLPDPTGSHVVMVQVVHAGTPKESQIASTLVSTWGEMAEKFSQGYRVS